MSAPEEVPQEASCAYWFGPPVAFGHCTTHGVDIPLGGCCPHERVVLLDRAEQARVEGDLVGLRSALAILDVDAQARTQPAVAAA